MTNRIATLALVFVAITAATGCHKKSPTAPTANLVDIFVSAEAFASALAVCPTGVVTGTGYGYAEAWLRGVPAEQVETKKTEKKAELQVIANAKATATAVCVSTPGPTPPGPTPPGPTPPGPTPPTPECNLTVTPTFKNIPYQGEAGTIQVTASSGGCAWSASSNFGFCTITGSTNNGNGTVSYSVAANTGGARACTLNVAGQTVTLSQSAAPTTPTPTCTNISVQPNVTTDPTNGSGSVSVTTSGTNCSWSAKSNNTDWLGLKSSPEQGPTVPVLTGTASGTIWFSTGNNTGGQRQGTITVTTTVGVFTVTVTQKAKSFTGDAGALIIIVTFEPNQ